MKKVITYKILKDFLLGFYKYETVKQILRPNFRLQPRYEIMKNAWAELGVPFEAWENIRAWLSEQEAKQTKKVKK